MTKNRLKGANRVIDYYERLVGGLKEGGGMDLVSLSSIYERLRAALQGVERLELESAIERMRDVIEALLQQEADLQLLKRAKQKLEEVDPG